MGVNTTGPVEWRHYGSTFLAALEKNQDWQSIEALWRFGGPSDMTRLAEVMASSGDDRLALVLARGLLKGTYVTQVPTLPEILHQHAPIVSATTAAQVLDRLLSKDEPLPAEYVARPHLIVAWLMRQSGSALDDIAVEIAVGAHEYANIGESKDTAIDRIARSGDLGARTVQRFADDPALCSTGTAWTRAADVVGRIGNPRGRAALVRSMTIALLDLPPDEAVQPSAAFGGLIEKHATRDLADAFKRESLTNTPGTAAAVQLVAGFRPGDDRDDLVVHLAAHQPTLWSAHRAVVYRRWTTSDWDRMLTRWGDPGVTLLEPGEVLADAPEDTNLNRIRVAIAQRGEPGDRAAAVARGALRPIVGSEEDQKADVSAVVAAVPWDLVETHATRDYLASIFNGILAPADQCAIVMTAYTENRLEADGAADLVPDHERVTGFGYLAAGPKRAHFTTALYDWYGEDDEDLQHDLRTVIDASNDTFDVIDAVADHNCRLAFQSFDLDRWHDLDSAQQDRLVDLLDAHATADQADLLDLIAEDSDGQNTARRARAARRWAALAEMHAVIPPGVLSLLESTREPLIQAFAEIAATVQPRDEGTLVSLQARWLNGGKTGKAARAALDNVAAGVVEALAGLRPPDRREQCPPLLHILGITAAPATFPTLLSYVGDDGVDDNPDLRRAAAAAIRAFVDITPIDADQFTALGARVSTETNPLATADLRNALAAADLGDDAAILGLYDLVGLDPDEVGRTPDELFGTQKHRLMTALKKMRVQQALLEPGWDGYVEQMDLVGEALVRAAYLKFGPAAGLKEQINSDRESEPDYGSLVKALAQAKDFGPTSAHLQTVHHIRTTRTAAHHPTGGGLDADAVIQAESALRTGAIDILNRLRSAPPLRSVPDPTAANKDAS